MPWISAIIESILSLRQTFAANLAFAGCVRQRREYLRLKRRTIFSDLAARVELGPFPVRLEPKFFRNPLANFALERRRYREAKRFAGLPQ